MDYLDTVVLAYKNVIMALQAIEDEHDPLHEKFMESTVEQVEEWRQFAKDCQSHGIQLLMSKSN